MFRFHPGALIAGQPRRFEEDRDPCKAEPEINERILYVTQRKLLLMHGGADNDADQREEHDEENRHAEE